MPDYVVAYILSAPRSGSTLLDNLLASHPEVISLGEVHHLKAYALDDRRFYDPRQPLLCTCGSTVPQCAFWASVQRELGSQLSDLNLKSLMSPQLRATFPRYLQVLLRLPVAAISRHASIFRCGAVQKLFDGKRIGIDSFRLFDAVHRVSGTSCIVDASKSPFRLNSLWELRQNQVRTIMLCRDYKAVTHSRMKRGESLRNAIESWVQWQENAEALTRDMQPSSIFRLTYERLCSDPDDTMRQLWDFLGLNPCDRVQRQSVETMHHLGGSPSKRDHDRRTVRLDTEHAQAFTASDLARLRELARPYAQKWGYD